ncbi:hypothetical protein MRX96_020156 [Rhipicephalus microplus]
MRECGITAETESLGPTPFPSESLLARPAHLLVFPFGDFRSFVRGPRRSRARSRRPAPQPFHRSDTHMDKHMDGRAREHAGASRGSSRRHKSVDSGGRWPCAYHTTTPCTNIVRVLRRGSPINAASSEKNETSFPIDTTWCRQPVNSCGSWRNALRDQL